MKITTDVHGYRIEPDTGEEKAGLNFLNIFIVPAIAILS